MDDLIDDLALLVLQPKPALSAVRAMTQRAEMEISSRLRLIEETLEARATMPIEHLLATKEEVSRQDKIFLIHARRTRALVEMLLAMVRAGDVDDEPTPETTGDTHGGRQWPS